MDAVALADTNNPTMHNPACTVCHTVMDPVAGAFQDYGDDGLYKDQRGGMDSLHELYKNDPGTALNVEATSWQDRKALSWPLYMAAGPPDDEGDIHEPFLGRCRPRGRSRCISTVWTCSTIRDDGWPA